MLVLRSVYINTFIAHKVIKLSGYHFLLYHSINTYYNKE